MTEFEKKIEDWMNANLEHAKNVAELIQNSSPEQLDLLAKVLRYPPKIPLPTEK